MTKLLDRRHFLAGGLVLLAGVSARADDGEGERDEDDHEEARRALEAGQVKPLSEILVNVEGKLGGRIVGIELERRRGRYIYEFKVLTPSGKLREIYVDATSAEILKEEGD